MFLLQIKYIQNVNKIFQKRLSTLNLAMSAYINPKFVDSIERREIIPPLKIQRKHLRNVVNQRSGLLFGGNNWNSGSWPSIVGSWGSGGSHQCTESRGSTYGSSRTK